MRFVDQPAMLSQPSSSAAGILAAWGALALALTLAGCSSPKPDLASPLSSLRIQAASEAALNADRTKVSELIDLLQSDDPAVRLVAIRSLEKLTGQTLGYRHFDAEPVRRSAIQSWVDWYQSRTPPTPLADTRLSAPPDRP
jgi:HEAT repeat protein